MKNNDKTLIIMGVVLLIFFGYSITDDEIKVNILETNPDLKDLANRIIPIINLFVISIISAFIGTPISRTINNIIINKIHNHNIQKIPLLNEQIASQWTYIVDTLEHHQYTSLLVKLRQAGIQDKFEISIENSFTILPSFLDRTSNLLFRIVDSIDEIISREKKDIKELIAHQKNIISLRQKVQTLKHKNQLVKSLTLISVFLSSFIVAVSIADYYKLADSLSLITGFGFVAVSFPSALVFHHSIGLISAMIWRRESTIYDDFIFKFYSFIFSSLLFSAIFGLGVFYLSKVSSLLGLYSSALLPSHNINEIDNILKYSSLYTPEKHVILIIISVLTISYLLNLVIVFSVKKYEHYFYSPHSSDYVIPPELIKMFGLFLVFILSSGMLYTTLYGYINTTEITFENIVTSKKQAKDNQISSYTPAKNKGEITDYIPYSIFLAIVGGILAVSTRDLLENYFAGLSLRVNLPFEEGDRVTIDGSEMLEVRRIGVRSNEFYGIKTNTLRNIPHKLISNFTVVNYTHPTLDYRKYIKISIAESVDDNNGHTESIPRRAEKLLLLSAYFSKGVKLPEVSQFIENKNFWIDIEKDNQLRKGLFIEKIPNIISRSPPNSKDRPAHNEISTQVKETINKIIKSKIAFDKDKEEFINSECENFSIAKITDNESKDKLLELAKIPVNISYDYFLIAEKRWRLKDFHNSISVKRTIDSAGISLLDAPRVTSCHKIIDGNSCWEVELVITVELEEQSDEVEHHINCNIADMWDIFGLPKNRIEIHQERRDKIANPRKIGNLKYC